MKTLKKFLVTLLLCLAAIFGLTACNVNGDSSGNGGEQPSGGQTETEGETSTVECEKFSLFGDIDGVVEVSEENFSLSIGEVSYYSEYQEQWIGTSKAGENGDYFFYPTQAKYTEKYFGSPIYSEETQDSSVLSSANIYMKKIDEGLYVLKSQGRGLAYAVKVDFRLDGRSYLLSPSDFYGYDFRFPLHTSSEMLSEVLLEDAHDFFIGIQVRFGGERMYFYEDPWLSGIEVSLDASEVGETTLQVMYADRSFAYSCLIYDPQAEASEEKERYFVLPSGELSDYVETGASAETYFENIDWILYDADTREKIGMYVGQYTVSDWDSSVKREDMRYSVKFEYDGESLYYENVVNVCSEEEKDEPIYFSELYFEKASYQGHDDVIYVEKGTDISEGVITASYHTYANEYFRNAPCTIGACDQIARNLWVIEIICEATGYSERRVVYEFEQSKLFPVDMDFEGVYIDEYRRAYLDYSEAYIKITYCDGSVKELSSEISLTKLVQWFEQNRGCFYYYWGGMRYSNDNPIVNCRFFV